MVTTCVSTGCNLSWTACVSAQSTVVTPVEDAAVEVWKRGRLGQCVMSMYARNAMGAADWGARTGLHG